ncbi:Hpt domain-containing protein [Desulfohalobium retbaense]|uniref:Chemotaxis protein CheA n=1 Tax=Desulfohalobium retbaense (strain ATCC 49708 / DSM 5692 / JCM 16813 / HR100) TaxID=485915 RepID=C8X0K1_DESRD|nr:Hpt domain-containing protein [Desulfohalobium retbaense]ACV67948.1 CheA signal transduction histidine kinase [Desulfohalobium retbaense DSM 5692]
MSTDTQHVQGIVEAFAEQLVLFDPEQQAEVDRLAQTLQQLRDSLNGSYPRCRAAADAAAALVREKLGAESSETDESHLAALQKLARAFQGAIIEGKEEEILSFPEHLDPEGSTGPEGDELAAGVDQEIFAAYIAQQESALGDLEEYILEYEKHHDTDNLDAVRRLVHTAKGEAGVMGLGSIAEVCHGLEDYIQDQGQAISPDTLLAFKDWFQSAVEACRRDAHLPDTAAVMGLFTNEGEVQGPSAGAEGAASPAAPAAEASDDPLLQPVPISDPEITGEFISEAQEHFEIADENLLTLESDPDNLDAVAAVFRAFHTIKGTCGFLDLTPIAELAHKAENLLDEVRKENLTFRGEVVDATFSALDMLKKMVGQLEEALGAGAEYVPDPSLRQTFDFVNRIRQQPQAAAPSAPSPQAAPSTPEPASSEPESSAPAAPEPAPAASAGVSPSPEPSSAQPEPETAPAQGEPRKNGQKGMQIKQTMKIDADRIDLLLDTIGELVIIESIVTQDEKLSDLASPQLERNLAQLTKITRSLQDMGMSMRMVPIETTFRRMARLVRDLGKKSGKKVELEMVGKETELDKAMVEKLGDPLVHMIRNAVDHGIEPTPEDRVAAGKSAEGRIWLKAFHEGGSIHIVIEDDGRGLNREAIAAKAVERGIIESANGMSDEEIYGLIFAPGFSTAAQVTDVSGRGVGMDVVKSNIENLRGNIRIRSTPGEGTTFTLVLPLTMAIIDGMQIKVGSERYILPLLSIIQSFQPTKEMVATVVGKGETLPFRGRLLPLFRLSELFGVDDAETDPTQAIAVVVEDGGRQVALLVDELLGQNQTVIKSLGEAMGSIRGVSGASILSDGTPGLIIDVNGVVRMATNQGGGRST